MVVAERADRQRGRGVRYRGRVNEPQQEQPEQRAVVGEELSLLLVEERGRVRRERDRFEEDALPCVGWRGLEQPLPVVLIVALEPPQAQQPERAVPEGILYQRRELERPSGVAPD